MSSRLYESIMRALPLVRLPRQAFFWAQSSAGPSLPDDRYPNPPGLYHRTYVRRALTPTSTPSSSGPREPSGHMLVGDLADRGHRWRAIGRYLDEQGEIKGQNDVGRALRPRVRCRSKSFSCMLLNQEWRSWSRIPESRDRCYAGGSFSRFSFACCSPVGCGLSGDGFGDASASRLGAAAAASVLTATGDL